MSTLRWKRSGVHSCLCAAALCVRCISSLGETSSLKNYPRNRRIVVGLHSQLCLFFKTFFKVLFCFFVCGKLFL